MWTQISFDSAVFSTRFFSCIQTLGSLKELAEVLKKYDLVFADFFILKKAVWLLYTILRCQKDADARSSPASVCIFLRPQYSALKIFLFVKMVFRVCLYSWGPLDEKVCTDDVQWGLSTPRRKYFQHNFVESLAITLVSWWIM